MDQGQPDLSTYHLCRRLQSNHGGTHSRTDKQTFSIQLPQISHRHSGRNLLPESCRTYPQSVEKTSATLYRNIDNGVDPQARYGKGALIHRQNLSLNKGEKQQLNLHKGKRAISLLQFNVKTDPDLKPEQMISPG